MNTFITIPCKWMSEDQATLESIGLDVSTDETHDKDITFLSIDNLYEFEDSTDGKIRTSIISGLKQFVTDWSIQRIKKEIRIQNDPNL